MKNKVLIVLVIFLILGCQKQSERFFPGLVGAYYGNSDLTEIRYAEVLTKLDNLWDENTGHGLSWSGQWEGFLTAPVDGNVTVMLVTNKKAELSLGKKTTVVRGEKDTARVMLPMRRNKKYFLKLAYHHEHGGTGILKLLWQWGGKSACVIPAENISFNEKQAKHWNWVIEPERDSIDPNQFLRAGAKHVIVYYQPGHFAGWPANNGIWSWDDEILVGFMLGYYRKSDIHHSIDETRPVRAVLARSLDGGETWTLEDPEHYVGDGDEPVELKNPIDFAHLDFAMRVNKRQFFISYNRGKNWQGPFLFPQLVENDITSRTDYLVVGKKSCLFFFSAEEKRVQARLQDRAFCACTDDGGKTVNFVSWITDSVTVRSVMPSTVQLSKKHLITALRRRWDEFFSDRPQLAHNWIDVYESQDGGKTWHFLSKVADTDHGGDNGNPPSLVLLRDGRLVVTYGFRGVPYGIRAKISGDNGKTWSKEILLRDDALTWDIGYTRSVQRPDGKIVTIYYYSTPRRREQHIEATIWEPDAVK